MNIYESIMQGLIEAIVYEQGEKTTCSNIVTIAPFPEVSASETRTQNTKHEYDTEQPCGCQEI